MVGGGPGDPPIPVTRFGQLPRVFLRTEPEEMNEFYALFLRKQLKYLLSGTVGPVHGQSVSPSEGRGARSKQV